MHNVNAIFRSTSSLGQRFTQILAAAGLSISLAAPICTPLALARQDIQKSAQSTEWYGEVRYYLTDETITIAKSATSDVKYDLADKKITFKIDPSVKTGSKVRVLEQDLGSGKRLVSITPRSH
jgi:hypothetical protein